MNTATAPTDPAVTALVAYFENLSPDNVAQLGRYYAEQARFKDPFNDVTGIPQITRIFEHMFVALTAPRFEVTQQVVQGEQCFLTWKFCFQFRTVHVGTEQVIWGATHLTFDPQGRVLLHRDYWDAAEELYEKLPLLGSLMRWLKRRANR